VFVQLVGEAPDRLAQAAVELTADGVYLVTRELEDARALCLALKGRNVLTEVVLPWHQTAPEQRSEGRIVDVEAARPVLMLEDLDVAAVPVGGGPGPYKIWRIPLWSSDVFAKVTQMRGDLLYALPWGSILPKELLKKYNRYGGALPGVISLPNHQFRVFIAAGAVKISFRSDCALAFLNGTRESLYCRPEVIEVSTHFLHAEEELKGFLAERLRELGP
jgi:fructose/tagatose bisphosphate aldolase